MHRASATKEIGWKIDGGAALWAASRWEPREGAPVAPRRRRSHRNARTWSAVGTRKGVKDSGARGKAVVEVQPGNVKFGLRLSQVGEVVSFVCWLPRAVYL